MESKQNFFRESHQFWMMSDEFSIISLKTPFIQTTPYCPKKTNETVQLTNKIVKYIEVGDRW